MFNSGLHQQTIDDNLNGVVLSLIEAEVVFQIYQFPIHSGPSEAMLDQFVHLLFEFTLSAPHDRGQHHDAVFGSQSHYSLDDLFRGLTGDGATAFGAMGSSNRGEQKTKIIINFSDCSDSGTWTAAGCLLLDRDGRAQPVDGVHVGALHLVQKLTSVSRKRLYVPPLAFRIDGVERQGRLARTAQAGNNGQRVTGDFDVYVLEIMLARAAHRDLGNSHEYRK